MVTTALPIWTRAHMRSRRCQAAMAVMSSPVDIRGPAAVAVARPVGAGASDKAAASAWQCPHSSG
jgi:hypothetical protein